MVCYDVEVYHRVECVHDTYDDASGYRGGGRLR